MYEGSSVTDVWCVQNLIFIFQRNMYRAVWHIDFSDVDDGDDHHQDDDDHHHHHDEYNAGTRQLRMKTQEQLLISAPPTQGQLQQHHQHQHQHHHQQHHQHQQYQHPCHNLQISMLLWDYFCPQREYTKSILNNRSPYKWSYILFGTHDIISR